MFFVEIKERVISHLFWLEIDKMQSISCPLLYTPATKTVFLANRNSGKPSGFTKRNAVDKTLLRSCVQDE